MTGSVLALCGGIGGAKLALGLSRSLGAGELTILVNTGDDFEHLGLKISPDIDTVLYTLAGRCRSGARMGSRGRDVELHVVAARSSVARAGFSLAIVIWRCTSSGRGICAPVASSTDFVEQVAHRLGINPRILPMTDEDVRTIVETDEGTLEFQRYFVEQRCRPRVRSLWFCGACRTRVSAAVSRAIFDASRAIIICPSNPYLSIDPILSIPGMRAALQSGHRTDRRRVADHRRPGGQRTDGEDHVGARHAGDQRVDRRRTIAG